VGGADCGEALREQRECGVEKLLSYMTEKRFSRFPVFLGTVECSQQKAPVGYAEAPRVCSHS
jgi:hypothetical protein